MPELGEATRRRTGTAGAKRARLAGSRRMPGQPLDQSECHLSTNSQVQHDPANLARSGPGRMRQPSSGRSHGSANFWGRIKGRIRYKALQQASPVAVPVPLAIGQDLVNKSGVVEAGARGRC